jgi:transcriptional regulator with XRE-family HTH domain
MENSEVRHKNLQLLRTNEGGTQKAFAAKIGTSPNSLNQMLTRHRNVGTQTARKIETRLKLSRGWMDQPRPKEWETMLLAAYDERLSRSRAVSRRGISIAARVDSLMDDRAVDLILNMIDMLEERQSAQEPSPVSLPKRPTSG